MYLKKLKYESHVLPSNSFSKEWLETVLAAYPKKAKGVRFVAEYIAKSPNPFVTSPAMLADATLLSLTTTTGTLVGLVANGFLRREDDSHSIRRPTAYTKIICATATKIPRRPSVTLLNRNMEK